MFETAVVRARAADRRFSLLTLSIAAHTAVVAAVIAASLASTRLPDQAPKQMMPVFFSRPIIIPLPLGHTHPASPKPKPAVAHVEPALSRFASAGEPALRSVPTMVTEGPVTTIGVPWGVRDSISTDATPSVAPVDAGPLPVGKGVTAPVVIRRVEPLYPPFPLRAHMSGSVVLQCIIDKSGRIRDVRVVTSTFGAFEQPAIDAVQQWLFAPGTLKGEPVDTIFELTVRFQMR